MALILRIDDVRIDSRPGDFGNPPWSRVPGPLILNGNKCVSEHFSPN
jgi:hypothetical protein